MEICPNCGSFVDELYEETGWCYSCSDVAPPNLIVESWYIKWLNRNADEIERTMVVHVCTAATAKKLVAEANRPICLACSKPIERGKSTDVFCRTNPICRRASDIYINRRSLSKEEGIQKALEEVVLLRLLNKERAA